MLLNSLRCDFAKIFRLNDFVRLFALLHICVAIHSFRIRFDEPSENAETVADDTCRHRRVRHPTSYGTDRHDPRLALGMSAKLQQFLESRLSDRWTGFDKVSERKETDDTPFSVLAKRFELADDRWGDFGK